MLGYHPTLLQCAECPPNQDGYKETFETLQKVEEHEQEMHQGSDFLILKKYLEKRVELWH